MLTPSGHDDVIGVNAMFAGELGGSWAETSSSDEERRTNASNDAAHPFPSPRNMIAVKSGIAAPAPLRTSVFAASADAT